MWYVPCSDTNEGVSPYQTVSFIYEDRPDVRSGYRAGSLSTSSKRLTNIVTVIGQYSLNYKTHASLQPSRLEQIEYCDVTGTTCREPIDFAWSGDETAGGWNQDNTFASPYGFVDALGEPDGTHLTDLNSDGFIDIAKKTAPSVEQNHFGSATGFTSTTELSLPIASYDFDGLIFIDLDADGDTDIIRGKNAVRQAWLQQDGIWVESSGFSPPEPFYLLDVDAGTRLMDINADGLVDMVRSDIDSGVRSAWINVGDDWQLASSAFVPNFGAYFNSTGSGLRLLDINGDGYDDIINGRIECEIDYGSQSSPVDDIETCSSLTDVRLASSNGWVVAPNLTPPTYLLKYVTNNGTTSNRGARFVDLNGDGLQDLVLSRSGQANLAWLNTGNSWVSAPEYALTVDLFDQNGKANEWRFVDVNGDGHNELMSPSTVLYHNGSTWVTFSEYQPPSGMGPYTLSHPQNASIQIDRGLRFLDINRDGFVDILLGGSSIQNTWLNTRVRAHISSITTDNNKIIDIDYRSQLDADVYSEDNAVVQNASIQKVNGPMELVYEVSVPNGLIANGVMQQRGKRYYYKGLKVHTQGLGSLGFSEITQTDLATGHYSISRYHQEYPYIGLPLSSQSFIDGDVLISEMNVLEFQQVSTQASSDCVRSDFVLVSNTACTVNDTATPVFPYIQKKEEIVYHITDDLTGNVGGVKTITENTYNTDGNPTNVTVTLSGIGGADASEYKTVVVNDYNDGIDTPQCHLGLLRQSTVTTRVDSQTDANSTRTTEFEYDPTSCLLTKEIVEPNANVDIRSETIYLHDGFGNTIQTSVTDGVNSRVATSSYNPVDYTPNGGDTLLFSEDGRFPIKITNDLGHSEYHSYYPDWGVERRMTGPNGLATCWDYDSLGRKELERQFCGEGNETKTTFAYHLADPAATGLDQVATVVVSQSSNLSGNEVLPESRTYLDQVGRELRKVSYSFTDDGSGAGNHIWLGQLVFTDSIYDNVGRMTDTSAPYYGYSTAPVYWSVTTFDSLNRLQSISTPLGVLEDDGSTQSTGTTSINYLGFVIEITDAKGRIKREEKNANGQLVRVTQAQGTVDETTLDYTYTLPGEIYTTQILGLPETLVTLGYDVLGRKTSMSDPDMGDWSYQYNAFGELREQTDAKGQVTVMAYDSLGRLESRTDKESDGTTAQVSSWSYYDSLTDPLGSIGKLKQESADNLTSASYTYNQYGRLQTTTQNTTGSSFVSSQTYDRFGRVDVTTYPAVGNEQAYNIQRHYNSLGMLWYITGPSVSGATNTDTVYWIADSIDQRGQLEEARNHNATEDFRDYDPTSGWLKYTDTYNTFQDNNLDQLIQLTKYSFDEMGNVMTRKSRLAKDGGASISPTATETFQYDDLDRITEANVNRPLDTPVYDNTKTYDQDTLGNLTYKSDVGYYRYGSECSTNAAGPHAVCEVVDAGGSNLRQYQYDANGNMTWGGANGFERNITFSTFNKPTIITQGVNETRFTYGASRSRVYRDSTEGNENKTTYYVGLGNTNSPLYELETNTTTDEETHLHFIYAGNYHGGHPFMMHVVKRDENDVVISTGQEYMHRDHLWSVIAISDHTGQVISPSDPNEQYAFNKSFDAWGKRRNPDWTEGGENQYTTDRGHLCYTGQESITNVGLIHMNGRVYDPELGRFISADPHVQFEKDSQSYNRYSYVLNNPLKYTDPTGYFLRKTLQQMSPFVATVITVVLNFVPYAGPVLSAGFSAMYAKANGASDFMVAFSAAVAYAGGQMGNSAAGIQAGVTASLPQMIASGAIAGAFSGGMHAMVNGSNFGRGVIQGAAGGAMTAAVVYGVRQSVANRVTQGSKVQGDQKPYR